MSITAIVAGADQTTVVIPDNEGALPVVLSSQAGPALVFGTEGIAGPPGVQGPQGPQGPQGQNATPDVIDGGFF